LGRRRGWVLRLVWGFILVAPAFCCLFIIYGLKVPTDFVEFYDTAIKTFAYGNLNAGSMGFYPPSAAPFFMLYAFMPAPAAAVVSCLFYAGLYFLVLRVLAAEAMFLPKGMSGRAWVYMAALMGGYVFYDLVTGQVSAMVIFATVMAFVWWRRGFVYRASAALALGIAFKLLPVVALLFFLIKRQWRMAAATVGLTALFGVVPGLCIFGPAHYVESWQTYHRHVIYPKSNPACCGG